VGVLYAGRGVEGAMNNKLWKNGKWKEPLWALDGRWKQEGTRKCKCGATISANKEACAACAK
jgi:hypothetical protein